jgi:hypothetical protein
MKRYIVFFAAFAATLALAMPAAAAAGATIATNGSFVEGFVPSDVRTAGGVTFFDLAGSENLTGTLSGKAHFTGSCVVRPAEVASCTAIETFTGMAADQSGTAVWLAVAQINLVTGSISGTFTILSGTRGLAGLHGEGTFQGTRGVGTYTGRLLLVP